MQAIVFVSERVFIDLHEQAASAAHLASQEAAVRPDHLEAIVYDISDLSGGSRELARLRITGWSRDAHGPGWRHPMTGVCAESVGYFVMHGLHGAIAILPGGVP